MSINPPRQRLPPLNALRAFEAAARLGGISKAADELCVTPGAIAQHVKALEDWAGAKLFSRQAKGVVLNDLGQRCLSDFETAFDQIHIATQNLRIRAAPNSIRIAALPSLAQLWVSPRMPLLRAKFPDARISIAALEQPPNLDREGYDIAVFLEPTDAPSGQVMAMDMIGPVCTPSLAQQLKGPTDLSEVLWLKDSIWENDWAHWLLETKTEIRLQPQSVSFSLYALAVDEACNGAGVLMGHKSLVSQHLQSGRLVAPFGMHVRTDKVITASLRDNEKRFLPGQIVDALAQS
ncbi:MAG: DNA-binding transcriptional LysR family regulator [Paracoccaceae bacterium]|jgi:DNA-binding transcriptional LysR family regulator